MNMNLLDFLLYCKKRKVDNLIISDKGYCLSDKEVKAYVRWGIENGYTTLKELPEFEIVKDKLKL